MKLHPKKASSELYDWKKMRHCNPKLKGEYLGFVIPHPSSLWPQARKWNSPFCWSVNLNSQWRESKANCRNAIKLDQIQCTKFKENVGGFLEVGMPIRIAARLPKVVSNHGTSVLSQQVDGRETNTFSAFIHRPKGYENISLLGWESGNFRVAQYQVQSTSKGCFRGLCELHFSS